ncbi:MAG: hypothetical protein EHM48_09855, partial [Planctomycetaceae bacterium]
MNEHEKIDERFPEVIDGLRNIAADINRQTYPGQAWPVRKRRGLRIFFWPAISAAASIMLSITLASYFTKLIMVQNQTLNQNQISRSAP